MLICVIGHVASDAVNATIRVERTESVPEDATIRHYDELPSETARRFPALAEGVPSDAVVENGSTLDFTDGEFVVFTGYYRVQVAE